MAEHTHFRKMEGEYTVVISDMEGFTKTTRRLGIVHFAACVAKMRSLLRPICEYYGVSEFFTEADNLWMAWKNDRVKPIACALACAQRLEQFNASVPEDYKIKLSGFGMAFGCDLWLDEEGKMYGPTLDKAFVLGEDNAEEAEVILHEDLYEAVHTLPELEGLVFEKDDSIRDEVGFSFYHVRGTLPSVVALHDIPERIGM